MLNIGELTVPLFHNNKDMSKKKFVFGMALGALAGLVAGYLLSGKKPSQMGEDLKKAADKVKDKLSSMNPNV
jgi:gas vesicle protein